MVDLLDVSNLGAGVQGWKMTGPSHYFTAPTFERFDPEGHAGVTHEMDLMRLVVLPEVPRAPLHIRKERLEGVSHARACHSTSGQSQQVSLNCLWLMHGNFGPTLRDPDIAQMDRMAPVHLRLQYGNLEDPEHLWSVPEADRRQEDASIKQKSVQGLFAAELFQHCRFARATLTNGVRNIEPRPSVVIEAVQNLCATTTGDHDLEFHLKRFAELFLEPRSVWIESVSEVGYAVRKYLREQNVELQSRNIGQHMKPFETLNIRGTPRASPTSLRIYGYQEGSTRGTAPCYKRQEPDGRWSTYGLNEPGRIMMTEQMKIEMVNRRIATHPPEYLTNAELNVMIASSPVMQIPERFPQRLTAAQRRAH